MAASSYIIFIIVIFLFYYACKLLMNYSIEKFEDSNCACAKSAVFDPTNNSNPSVNPNANTNVSMAAAMNSINNPNSNALGTANTVINNTVAANTVAANANKPNDNLIVNTNTKKKEDNIERTPAESGLVFGYLPKEEMEMEIKDSKLDPNTIYDGSIIEIFNNNLYLGMSEKNPLLPIFLEKLGTFMPYNYQTIKIHVKDKDFNATAALEDNVKGGEISKPIFYNKTVVCFTIKHLQNNYFLQYVPETSTFYLTEKPSYFNLINATNISSVSEARYKDSILLKCLDNSEYVLIYDSFMVTESNKSSTFVISKAENIDICVNFSKSDVDLSKFIPQFIENNQARRIKNTNKNEIDTYLAKLNKSRMDEINNIKANLVLLEKKKQNLTDKIQLSASSKKIEYDSNLKKEKEIIDKEIKEYQTKLENEYNEYKKKLIETKSKSWETEIAKFRKDILSKC